MYPYKKLYEIWKVSFNGLPIDNKLFVKERQLSMQEIILNECIE